MSMMDYAGPGDQSDTTSALLSAATGRPKPTRADFDSALADAETSVQTAVDAAQDPEEKAVLSKCLNAIHGVQASHQKLQDQATGTGAGPKLVRRIQGNY